jgi:energy-converting hydrogenase Eha subunit G
MDLDSVGTALIVGGAALVCSGLVFMLLVLRKRQVEQEEIEGMDNQPPESGTYRPRDQDHI